MHHTLRHHHDPGHGWVEVPMSIVRELGLAGNVSGYSYISTDYSVAYLEEDCDASLVIEALKARGDTVEVRPEYANGDSPIRRLPRFRLL